MKSEPSEIKEDEGELTESLAMEFEADDTVIKSEADDTVIKSEEDDPNSSEIGETLNINDGGKRVLLTNLISKCRTEMEKKCLLIPLEDYVERVVSYSGLSKANIHQFIFEEMKDLELDNRHFQLEARIQIFQYVAHMYIEKQIPTFQNIFALMSESFASLNLYQFQYMMNLLGFENQLTNTGHEILVEDPELTFERCIYFRKLNSFKTNSVPIYYIDEVFVDKTFTFPKPWVKNIDVSCNDCDGYVFFHAVSKHGFLNGLFCSPATQRDFTRWVAHFVIPQLKDPSVVVLDQNYLHRSKKNAITKYHSKKDMVNYLRQCNIPCDENLHKADLYKLIKDYTPKTVSFDIDELFKAHGHHVLWLPATFHDLSITYFLWKNIIETKRDHLMTTQLQGIKNVLLETVINLPSDLWQTFSDCLHNYEKDLFTAHLTTSTAFENNYSLSENVLK